MQDYIIYSLISTIIVSLTSLLVGIPLLLKKKFSKKLQVFLLSISVGVLLATVFIDFIPETFLHSDHEDGIYLSFAILFGFIMMFITEKFIHFHHSNKCEHKDHGHSHAYHLAPINLIGDGVHNFLDGLVILGAFATNSLQL